MKIIALADIHGSLGYLPDVSEAISTADLVLIAGDITEFGGPKDVKIVINELRKYNQNIFAVIGNCDSPAIGSYLAAEGIGINCNCRQLDSVNFVGLSGTLEADQPQLGDSLEEHFGNTLVEIEKQTASLDPLVLVTHQPASRTAVDSRGGGSDAIFDFIQRRQPILALSGHIHESPGKDTIGSCVLVNPGPFHQGFYAQIEIQNNKVTKAIIHTC